MVKLRLLNMFLVEYKLLKLIVLYFYIFSFVGVIFFLLENVNWGNVEEK